MKRLFAAILAIGLGTVARAAVGQGIPEEMASPSPSASPMSEPAVTPPLPPAGVIPSNISLDVTGTPVADGNFLDAQIRKALDRRIRPTLRPGTGLSYGPIVPWPILPLPAGSRAAVNVMVTISGDAASAPVSGVTTVTLANLSVQEGPPSVLFLSDDPEYLPTEGLVFRGSVGVNHAARLYYYHSDIGVPRDLDAVLTASVPTRVHIVDSEAGPDLDVMNVGHTVSRDFLWFQQHVEGTLVDLTPGQPFIVRHALVLQGEVVAGSADVHVVSGGPVGVSVVASPAGSRPDSYLAGPRVPFDGHARHGTFDLDGYGNLAATFTVGGPDTAVKYGGRDPSPRNLDANDAGRDYGDYGVVHHITFTLANPTDAPQLAYLYEKPLGGPVRSTFLIDGQLKELGCARMPQPYWLATYQLPPHSTGASTTVTMTDGGSFYPLEFGVTVNQPQPYTPPIGAPDGCSSNVARLSDSVAGKSP